MVELSVGVHGALDHGLDALLVAHVHADAQRLPAFGLELGGEGLRALSVVIGDHDLESILRQRGADRRTQTARLLRLR